MQRARALLDLAQRRHLELAHRGVDIALLDWGGEGPPILLHHANGFCKGVFGRVVEELGRDFRVLAMDGRGHGDTRFLGADPSLGWDEFALDIVAVAEALCAELGVSRLAAGVGHSFGGTSMLGAAARRPELFATTLLLDPVTPHEPPGGVLPPHANELVERARKRRADWPDAAEARAWFAERALFADWDPTALDLYVLDGLRPLPTGGVGLKCSPEVEAAVFAGRKPDLERLAEKASPPCLWVWAEGGNFPRDRHQGLVDQMPDARLEVAPCGHLIPMECPGWVAAALRRLAR